MTFKDVNSSKHKSYPDLEGTHSYAADDVMMTVQHGSVTFFDKSGNEIKLSEWGLGNIIEEWLINRMGQRQA